MASLSTDKLPEGIEALRQVELPKNGTTRPELFDRIVGILERCAGDRNPEGHRCSSCQYRAECRRTFDILAGHVAQSKSQEL